MYFDTVQCITVWLRLSLLSTGISVRNSEMFFNIGLVLVSHYHQLAKTTSHIYSSLLRFYLMYFLKFYSYFNPLSIEFAIKIYFYINKYLFDLMITHLKPSYKHSFLRFYDFYSYFLFFIMNNFTTYGRDR